MLDLRTGAGAPAASTPGRRAWVGAGSLVAVMLLLLAEAILHGDGWLLRYRSVFAAGRALDKIVWVERNRPALVFLGDSRTDNGFDPSVVAARLPGLSGRGAFNLGMPGADARILHGVLKRLERQGLLGPHAIGRVVIGLDEAMVQETGGLGYEVFFADRSLLLRPGELTDWLRSVLRLWGYADNLKELREPAKMERFVQATLRDIDPVGGGAGLYRGYRAGFGGAQDAGQALQQEVGSRNPPSANRTDYLFRMLDLLRQRQVRVAIVFPPVLPRDSMYGPGSEPAAEPFQRIAASLQKDGLPLIELDRGARRDPAEFVNPGHLNDRGARRYSAMTGDRLAQVWPELAMEPSR